MASFDLALPIVLKHEGGFVNDPSDPGGATNHGVTQRVWEAWVGHAVTVEDMQALTVADVTPLYRAKYWNLLKLDGEPNQALAASLFDFFVNVSPKTFHQVVAEAMPLSPDSLFRAKAKHYVAETQRRRDAKHPDGTPQYTRAEADKYLEGWLTRALEMVG